MAFDAGELNGYIDEAAEFGIRTVGYDFNFNACKSVSLLYARYQDQDILSAFRESVRETMDELESEMKTRVRKGRQDTERTTGNLTWAEYVHFTARPVEGVSDTHLILALAK